ncbi:MAG: hypothetical protein ACXVZX_07315 [Terriglobales bacterium]
MSARSLFGVRLGSNRWMHQVAGIVLAGVGIIGVSQPTAKVSIHCLEDAAVYRLAPIAKRTEVGRQLLAMYTERDASCHRI